MKGKRLRKTVSLLVAAFILLVGFTAPASAGDKGETPAFKPYGASVRWVLPESWPAGQTPTNRDAIFPQTRLAGELPCGRWSQDDQYWIENKNESHIFKNLGNTLDRYEDSKIYKSHTFTYGGDCKPEIPAPLVVTVDTGVAACGVTSVPTQTTTTTYDWVLEYGKWVKTSSDVVTTGTRPLTAAEADRYSPLNCAEKPDSFSVITWNVAGKPKCGESTVTQTGVENYYQFVWNGSAYVKTWVKSVDISRQVKVDVTPCPTTTPTPAPTVPPATAPKQPQAQPQPELAATGANAGLAVGIAGGLILAGAVMLYLRRPRNTD